MHDSLDPTKFPSLPMWAIQVYTACYSGYTLEYVAMRSQRNVGQVLMAARDVHEEVIRLSPLITIKDLILNRKPIK